MRQLKPKEVQEYLAQAENNTQPMPVLLDVREPHEFEYCHIENSVNVPLGQIPAELQELDPEQEYVLICHHGVRSQRAGMFLAGNGFDADKLINLVGGIEAWACEVDPSMPRY